MDALTNTLNSAAVNRFLAPPAACQVCAKPALFGSTLCQSCTELDREYIRRMEERERQARKPEDSRFHELPLPRVQMGIVPAPVNPVAWVAICGFLFLAFLSGIAYQALR
jgi:hypothetical protein